jgi:hypothetical protein
VTWEGMEELIRRAGTGGTVAPRSAPPVSAATPQVHHV